MPGTILILSDIVIPFLIKQCDKTLNPGQVGPRRCSRIAKSQIMKIMSANNVKTKQELRTKYGLKEKENPLLDMSIDIYK